MLWNGIKMWSEVAQRHGRMHWRTVAQDVQVRFLEVHNPPSARQSDIRVSNVPFLGDSPVENRGSRRHLGDLQVNSLLDHRKRAPDSVAGDASTNRKKFLSESVQFLTEYCRIFPVDFRQKTHRCHQKSG